MRRSIPIAGIALLSLFSIFAIARAGMAPAAAGAALAPLRAAQEAPEPPAPDPQAVLNSACATCHDLAGVQPGLYTTAEWQETIDRMIGYGAALTEDQNRVIIEYLATDAATTEDSEGEAGPDEDGEAGPEEDGEADPEAAETLLASACATCHDLTGVQPGLYTAAEWLETINRMVEYGAAVTDEQADLIVDYLATDR